MPPAPVDIAPMGCPSQRFVIVRVVIALLAVHGSRVAGRHDDTSFILTETMIVTTNVLPK
jgi:coenzyme F420-reducing hydrogenase gamma subunit